MEERAAVEEAPASEKSNSHALSGLGSGCSLTEALADPISTLQLWCVTLSSVPGSEGPSVANCASPSPNHDVYCIVSAVV
eukprot:4059649-Amphidinium_carterae.1